MTSIVIPHYNRSDLLLETVASVAAQFCPDWEVVVVDDGSSPAERQAIESLASEKVRIRDREGGAKGPSRCRNLGLEAAHGEFVLFLDSDDLLAPWCLEQRLRAAEENPNADAWVFPVLLFHNAPGDRDILWNRLDGGDPIDRFLRADPPWHTSSPLWRRSALLELGGFNECIFYGDDADLHLRALLASSSFQLVPDAVPDVFVRRSEVERITNRLSPDLLASRRVRLQEGSRLLDRAETGRQRTWEGQYFHEIEFLLYNLDQPRDAVDEIFTLWREQGQTVGPRRLAARIYAEAVLASRDCCYLITRIARRIAKVLLPRIWFPGEGGFENSLLDSRQLNALHERLGKSPRPCPAPVKS